MQFAPPLGKITGLLITGFLVTLNFLKAPCYRFSVVSSVRALFICQNLQTDHSYPARLVKFKIVCMRMVFHEKKKHPGKKPIMCSDPVWKAPLFLSLPAVKEEINK